MKKNSSLLLNKGGEKFIDDNMGHLRMLRVDNLVDIGVVERSRDDKSVEYEAVGLLCQVEAEAICV